MRLLPILFTALLLGGCSFLNEAVWPSLSDVQPEGQGPEAETGTPAAQAAEDPPLMRADAAQLEQLATLDAEITRLATSLPRHEVAYEDQLGQLKRANQQLENPYGPDDDTKVDRWNAEQIAASALENAVEDFRELRGDVAGDAALAVRLTAQLDALEQEISGDVEAAVRLETLHNRLLGIYKFLGDLDLALAAEEQRYAGYVTAAYERLGATRPEVGTPPPAVAPQPDTAPTAEEPVPGRKPFLTLNLDDPDQRFEDQLRSALALALERYPDLSFQLVALQPQDLTRSRLDEVLSILQEFGISGDRLSVDQRTDESRTFERLFLYPR